MPFDALIAAAAATNAALAFMDLTLAASAAAIAASASAAAAALATCGFDGDAAVRLEDEEGGEEKLGLGRWQARRMPVCDPARMLA